MSLCKNKSLINSLCNLPTICINKIHDTSDKIGIFFILLIIEVNPEKA